MNGTNWKRNNDILYGRNVPYENSITDIYDVVNDDPISLAVGINEITKIYKIFKYK